MDVKKLVFSVFTLFFLFVPSVYSTDINLVANSIDLPLAGDVISYWQENDINIIHLTAKEYSSCSCQNNPTVILGGPGAYEGVGEMVKELLSEEEQEEVRIGGRVFLKKQDNTTFFIYAGAERNDTNSILQEEKELILSVREEVDGFRVFIPTYEVVDKFTIEVKAENAPAIGSLQFSLVYDPSVIKVLELGKGELASNALMAEKIDNSAGKVTVGLLSLEGFSGSGTLVALSGAAERGNTTVRIYIEDISDPKNIRMSLPFVENGIITVGS